MPWPYISYPSKPSVCLCSPLVPGSFGTEKVHFNKVYKLAIGAARTSFRRDQGNMVPEKGLTLLGAMTRNGLGLPDSANKHTGLPVKSELHINTDYFFFLV